MAASIAHNTPQIEMCWAAVGCDPVKPPSSEVIGEIPHSDQILIPVLPEDRDDSLMKGKCSKSERMCVSEQVRRKRMKDLCSHLEYLLPSTTLPKLDRCSLYEEACKYIQKLQKEVEGLKRRREMYLRAKQRGCDDRSLGESAANYSSGASDNGSVKAVVKVYDREAIISIESSRKPRCHWRIVEEVEAHGLDVQMSQFFAGDFIVFLCFQANVNAQNGNPPEIQTSLESRLKVIY